MAKIAQNVRDALSLVAHLVVAAELEKKIPAPGITKTWQASLDSRQRAILDEFRAAIKRAPKDMLAELEKDDAS